LFVWTLYIDLTANFVNCIRLVGTCFENYIKLRSYSLLTLDTHTSAHPFNNQLANAESETSALGIRLSMLLDVAEIYEEAVDFVRGNPTAEVLDLYLKLQVFGFPIAIYSLL